MKRQARELIEPLLVPPGKKISLANDYDPDYTAKGLTKERAQEALEEGIKELARYQEMLYAQDRYAVLVILQAMDAAGKDGAIKHVMSGINPQGCQVYSFKAPSTEELDHDYLWRSFRALPERGRIGIFNRSYYEEVLVVRVHPELLARQHLPEQEDDKRVWRRRFDEINNFEKYLVANGTRVVKIFLNVSKKEQKKRFLERIEKPEKNWKFSDADVRERGHWDEYMSAFEDMFNHTSTEWAPWHIVPADHKWFTRLAVGAIVYNALASLDLQYPKLSAEHMQQLAEAKKLLDSEK
jgi:PPK2 family polyphosphate:nucleotide phosphotransferase